MPITLAQLDQQLHARKFAPLYLLLGPEAHLRESATARIRAALIKEHGAAQCRRLDAARMTPAACIDAASALNLFDPHQCLVVGDINAWDAEAEGIVAQYCATPNPATTVVVWTEKLDQRTKLAKILMGAAVVVECKPLYANQLPDWIRIECQRHGREVSREAARLLGEAVGSELGAVAQAIEKLVLYTEGRRLIEPRDVEAVVLATSQRTIFEFLQAVGRKEPAKAVHLLEQLLDGGEPPVRIGTMLAWHWRILLRAEAWLSSPATRSGGDGGGGMAAALKVSPYFAKEYAEQAKGFPRRALVNGVATLAQLDRRLKRSRVPARTTLTQAVMQLVSRPQS